MEEHPHGNQPTATAGTSLADADTAAIMIHGRGASADSILQLTEQLPQDGVTYLAPQAASREWYPNSFLSQVNENEPGRTSGLQTITALIKKVNAAGIDTDDILLIGFSQGACLATEYAARHPARYGGVAGFSGGLIGEEIDVAEYGGDLAGTPVFLGCSDRDPHIPVERVDVTADVFDRLNADVEKRIYEGMGHTINEDEMSYVQDMIQG